MPTIGASGYILLIILALLLFGPQKLPELGRALGRTFREFKNGARELMAEEHVEEHKSKPAHASATSSKPESATEQKSAANKQEP
ncbi:twin-arginine translocase TatA/TatE family subunit [Paenibacillus massiliensis]|uniref:twin-arginine translocase TatA/TatE family subunit n=1 Tax=Paenibacillus massiliensis TaxID=225917 RepID=UPI000375ED3D|nr:twin-arginine translocase TatA/TatE family subunit [Paenibacillus massiliensis]